MTHALPLKLLESLKQLRATLIAADAHPDIARHVITDVRDQLRAWEERQFPSNVTRLPGAQPSIRALAEMQLLRLLQAAPPSPSSTCSWLEHLGQQPEPGDPPTLIAMVGPTQAARTDALLQLAHLLHQHTDRSPMVVSADILDPARGRHLCARATQAGLDVVACHPQDGHEHALVTSCQSALHRAHTQGHTTVLLDAPSDSSVSAALLSELVPLVVQLAPHHTLLVLDATQGTDIIPMTRSYKARIQLDGFIVTSISAHARGGAALSLTADHHLPLTFVSYGADDDDMDPLQPDLFIADILNANMSTL
ncbi:MAG: hypothetical protein AAFX99_30175 [Myxococcota bacterium]